MLSRENVVHANTALCAAVAEHVLMGFQVTSLITAGICMSHLKLKGLLD